MPKCEQCRRWYLTWQIKDGLCSRCLAGPEDRPVLRYLHELPQDSPLRTTRRWKKLHNMDFLERVRGGETYVAFDTETTGLSPDLEAIIEIGAVKYAGGRCVETFSTLINTGRSIPEEITRLTHISQEMVREAPEMRDVLPEFASFIRDCPLVAHNARFDMQFLVKAAEDFDVDIGMPAAADSLYISKSLWPELPDHRLGTVVTHIGYVNEHAHRATDDAMAVAAIVEAAAGLPETETDREE